ncbi:LmbE family N-acetylglucosaminyl deacetylase [Novosphingobium sp. PhB55]|uniref:PIG-L deacetylase family protein n=1 Tax=Novosphingobium sp. PhB55 TaxID=2485106 RepID=UPI001066E582|nr:PIG-L family deacetylase [Novosphingobium sp. PhB55]TDW61543.1 LmbE family N-acetylglucosaminyl deacetylase [Novosphingobium sp. PhB55]
MVRGSLLQRSWRPLRWLVLAPHADDETLGAGALIAQTAEAGTLAGLVYLTDGSGSHDGFSGRTGHLVAVRRREAATALFRLTGTRSPAPSHLGWKDAVPELEGNRAFLRSARKLAALCRRRRVDILAVTALHEPHCDHAAAARLAYAVQRMSPGRLRVAEYLVWARSAEPGLFHALSTKPMRGGRRRHALQAHRSQLSASMGIGFRLPPARQRMPAVDTLYLRRSP